MKILIIIPAHNEEKRISKTLEEYGKFFRDLKNNDILDFEILVVINNSNDRTEELVKKFIKKYSEISYLNFKEGGKGFAIIEGFKEALKRKSDLIGFVDADMATSPQAYYELIKNLSNYDGIFASRYVKGSVVNPKQSVQRIIASRVFNFLIRTMFFMKYKDTQCGAKLFRTKAIETIMPNLSITKWAFDVDLIYLLKKGGFKLKEHPTTWSDMEYSKINLKKAGLKMVLAIIRLRLINSKLKDFVRFYDKLPEKLKISHRI